MDSKPITYIWKHDVPKNEQVALGVLSAAYHTAMATNPETTVILVRYDSLSAHKWYCLADVLTEELSPSSLIHGTTMKRSVRVKDAPHVTISLKTPGMEQKNQHQTCHGYTDRPRSSKVVKVVPDDVRKDSETKAWPKAHELGELRQEVYVGDPAKQMESLEEDEEEDDE